VTAPGAGSRPGDRRLQARHVRDDARPGGRPWSTSRTSSFTKPASSGSCRQGGSGRPRNVLAIKDDGCTGPSDDSAASCPSLIAGPPEKGQAGGSAWSELKGAVRRAAQHPLVPGAGREAGARPRGAREFRGPQDPTPRPILIVRREARHCPPLHDDSGTGNFHARKRPPVRGTSGCFTDRSGRSAEEVARPVQTRLTGLTGTREAPGQGRWSAPIWMRKPADRSDRARPAPGLRRRADRQRQNRDEDELAWSTRRLIPRPCTRRPQTGPADHAQRAPGSAAWFPGVARGYRTRSSVVSVVGAVSSSNSRIYLLPPAATSHVLLHRPRPT